MPATFTIEGELSEQGLLEAKTAIENILSESTAQPSGTDDIPDAQELALRKARLLREWAGPATWHFMSTIAQCYRPDQEFTFDDLRETFSVDKETVKSWHRSASKIMNKVDDELGNLPAFLVAEWDGSRQHYSMPDLMRDAIIEAGG
jgi:hypothetical protein